MNQTLHSNPASDRRRGDNRIPLGFDVLWDHSDAQGRIADGWDKAFEARGVNLSTGGLAMRVPFLPDVGERLACRITLPSPSSTPKCIVAGTEVVWASSQGQRIGEVGLRFVDLPNEHESLLESLLRGRYRPPTPEVAMKRMAQQISVDLDGVSDAIIATIVESDEGGVTVEQPLPFLRIGAQAQLRDGEDQPRAVHLSAVDLVVEGDMPKLLLDLSFGTGSVLGESMATPEPVIREHAQRPAADYSTTPGIPAPDDSQQARILQGMPVQGDPDDTIPDASADGDMMEPVDHPAPVPVMMPSLEEPTAMERLPVVPRVRQPSGMHELQRPVATEYASFDGEEEDFEASISALRRPNPYIELALTRIKAWTSALAVLIKTYVAVFRSRALPHLEDASRNVGSKALKGARRAARTVSGLLPMRSRRRTSQFPEARPQRTKRSQEEIPVAKRKWVGPAILVVGLVLAAYALWPSSDAEPTDDGVSQVELIEPSQTELSVADSFMEPLPEPPAALPELPSEPTLDEGTTFDEPELVEAAAPSVQPGSVEFGASKVSSARTYRLRMSRPIERIEGRAESTGFVVRIPGSLSLDRAGPISASHPLVRRSMILNHGDYAELTIQFGDKGVPAYRVRGVGSELELLIGTKI